MDPDVSMSNSDDYLQYFDLSPANFPWRAPRPQEIQMRRALMSDMLIFDILLGTGGITDPVFFYPPPTPDSLEGLLRLISLTKYDVLKRDCLVYFLLKWHQDGREEDFKIRKCIPPQFSALADAYWHLDSGINVARAVSILSDSRINRDYTTKVFQALSISDDPHTLIRTYVRTAKPCLTEPNDIDTYAIALAESSLMEAWMYQRTFPEINKTRERLVNKILDWCLTPKPRPTALKHLLGLPFSPYEELLVNDYALVPPEELPAASIPVIQELVCVRLVQAGQHAAAIKLDRQFSSVPRGGDKGLKVAHDRRQMLDELKAAMPVSERMLLELELEDFAQGRGMSGAKGKGRASELGTSMSWEQIRPLSSANVGKSNGVSVIGQRSGAPRFGGPAPAAPPDDEEEEVFPSISRGAPASPAIFASATGPPMPKTPSHSPFLFGGVPSQSAQSSNGWFPKTTNGVNGQTLFGGIPNGRTSLFDTVGSANATPNAFYTPPTTAGAKHTPFFGTPASQPVSAFALLATSLSAKGKGKKGPRKSGAADVSGSGAQELDISMLSELSDSDSARGNDSSFAVSRALDESPDVSMDTGADADAGPGFGVSVFGRSTSPRIITTSRGSRLARTETEARLPPGAFLPETDDEHPHEAHPSSGSSNVPASVAEAHDEEMDADLQAVVDGMRPTRAESAQERWAQERARQRAAHASVRNSLAWRGAQSTKAGSSAQSVEQDREEERPNDSEPVGGTEAAVTNGGEENKATRTSARQRAKGAAALKRSLPGGFMDDDDEEEEEEEEAPPAASPPQKTPSRTRQSARQRTREDEDEDEDGDRVAPLPAPTPARKQPPRKSRSAGSVVAVVAEAGKPTRRSSRLSAVSSVGSSSPEPVSPQKPSAGRTRRGARASNPAGSSASAKVAPGPKTRKRKA